MKKGLRKGLRIAQDLTLPIDAVTRKIAWVGLTGSGKTFGCKRMVEQMLRAGAQVVVLDGTGAWAGLRLGKKAFKIPVFGGLRGDIPLEPDGGTFMADLIVKRGISTVLDVSQMLDTERTKFATAFGQQFFQLKKAKPSAVHLVLEECEDFVPENPQKGEERMLHQFKRLAKQGRPHGIGVSFISQRPQEISKKALNQSECVFAFRTNGKHEREAIRKWLTDKGFEENLSDVLPHLEIGAPHVWSPWLKISRVVQILPIETSDTSRTPQVGDRKSKKPQALKAIDLKEIRSAMAETIERAKNEDPTELKKRVAELERVVKANERAIKISEELRTVVDPRTKLGEFDVVVDRRHLEKLISEAEDFEKEASAFEKVIQPSIRVFESARRTANSVIAAVRRARGTGSGALAKRLEKAGPPALPEGLNKAGARRSEAHSTRNGSGDVGRHSAIGNGGLYRIMVALAQHPRELSRRSLGLRAGLSARSGTFATYLGRARSEGWVEGKKDLIITDAGRAALGTYDPLPVGDELLAYWLKEVGEDSGMGRMLRTLADAFPNAISRSDLAERSAISSASGTFATYLGRLRGLELIEGSGEIRLSEELVG